MSRIKIEALDSELSIVIDFRKFPLNRLVAQQFGRALWELRTVDAATEGVKQVMPFELERQTDGIVVRVFTPLRELLAFATIPADDLLHWIDVCNEALSNISHSEAYNRSLVRQTDGFRAKGCFLMMCCKAESA